METQMEMEDVTRTIVDADGMREVKVRMPRKKRQSEIEAATEATAILREAEAVRVGGADFIRKSRGRERKPVRSVVTTSGVEFWVKSFGIVEVMALGMTMMRDDTGTIQPDGESGANQSLDKSQMTELMARCMAEFVVCGETDMTPAFEDVADALAFLHDGECAMEAVELTTAIASTVPNFMALAQAA